MKENIFPPVREKKTKITIAVEDELLEEVKKEAKVRGLKIRQVVEYGLRKFLEEATKQKTSG